MANMDKGLYAAPQGMASLAQDEEPIQVEIEDPEAVHISGPGFEMHMEKADSEFDINLAEEMDERDLDALAGDLVGDVTEDMNSRKDWLDTYIKGLQLLGIKYEERTEPWPGACGVYHPLLMEAAIKFQSETITETFPAAGPVRTVIIGKETPAKKESASRVEADMNYELTEVMQEYRPEHERTLLTTALAGNAFKKVYFDPSLGRQVAMFIAAEDVIVPYGAANLESAERITHLMRKPPNDLRKLQIAGFYRDIDLGDPTPVVDEVDKRKAEQQGFSASMDNRFQLLEIHCNLNLTGYEDVDKKGEPTGIKLPYVVTIERGTKTVLAIRRNWLEEDTLKLRRRHFVHYGYIPGFGFYYFGLIHLIGGHTRAATSLLRQLIDAGTLSNLPGGLKAKGLRIKGDDTPIAPGEFRDVDLPSGAIRDNILPLPYKEPSQTLVALMDKVVEDGRRFSGAGDLNISDMSAQAPVGTTLAVLERTLKVMGAIQARVHYAMKQEFKLLAAIIRDNTPEDYDYEPEVGSKSAKQGDYDQVDVIPVSDPNASTMAQRVVQYQAVLQLAQGAPQIYNLPMLHRQMIEVLGVKNASKLVPMQEDLKPTDPVSENMGIMVGKPVKAFITQDHDAHMAVHMGLLHDPKMMQVIGQNPQAQVIISALQNHIMEHMAYKYRADIQRMLGANLPPPPLDVQAGTPDGDDEEGYLDPQMEVQVSQLTAQAAAKLLQQNSSEMQQQQAMQQQQDPIIQMQQQELQLKQQELQMKQQIAMAELQMKQQQFAAEMGLQKEEIDRKARKDMLDASRNDKQMKATVLTNLQKNMSDHQHRQNDLNVRKTDTLLKHASTFHGRQVDTSHKNAERGAGMQKHASTLAQQERQAQLDRAHQIAQSANQPAGKEAE